jgi:hypothetical protein
MRAPCGVLGGVLGATAAERLAGHAARFAIEAFSPERGYAFEGPAAAIDEFRERGSSDGMRRHDEPVDQEERNMAEQKTVARKLAVKPGNVVWISHADRSDLIGELPEGATVGKKAADADVAVVFADDAASLREILTANKADIATPPVVWVAYPKANKTDINRDSLWPIVAEYGLRPNGQVAIDETWSALRFRAYKEGEAPFAP